MAKATLEVLGKCKSRQRRFKDEPLEKYVQRLTHFGLMKKGLTELTPDMQHCRNAAALYLYDNRLTRIQHIDQCRYLTSLYLQRNKIERISGLGSLISLEKLYLGGNAISVVEGLHNLPALRELHVENQDLAAGEKLVFDPRCFLALARTLEVLNVAGNRLDDLSDLANLRSLVTLNLSDNFIRSFRQLSKVLKCNEQLERLAIAGNPISHTKRIRERVIVLCSKLQSLDAETVTPIQRRFMMNWEEAKRNRRAAKPSVPSTEKPRGRAVGKFAAVPVPKFPSRLSSRNPHWLPPIPKLKDPGTRGATRQSRRGVKS